MESVGLMPSHTGKPGGRKTGQQMNDYTIKGSAFEKAFEKMPKNILLPESVPTMSVSLMKRLWRSCSMG